MRPRIVPRAAVQIRDKSITWTDANYKVCLKKAALHA